MPQINRSSIPVITGYVVGVLGTLFSILRSIQCVDIIYSSSKLADSEDSYYLYRYKHEIYELGSTIVYLVASILLVIGVNKKWHLIILPWLIVNVFVAIVLVKMLFFLLLYGFSRNMHQIVPMLLLGLTIALLCLIWMAVLALFMNIRSEKARNQIEMENQKRLLNNPPRYEVVQMNV